MSNLDIISTDKTHIDYILPEDQNNTEEEWLKLQPTNKPLSPCITLLEQNADNLCKYNLVKCWYLKYNNFSFYSEVLFNSNYYYCYNYYLLYNIIMYYFYSDFGDTNEQEWLELLPMQPCSSLNSIKDKQIEHLNEFDLGMFNFLLLIT